MTRRLILLRHAKSSWSAADLDDHDRALNDRGRRSCAAIGGWLKAGGHVPDQVLCSSAARTRETWDLIAPSLPDAPAAEILPALYLAETQTMFDILTGAKGAVVAMLGHNPGIGLLAHRLVAVRPAHPGFENYPTLATLIVDFAIDDWADLQASSGEVIEFIVPRDLTN